MASNPRLHRLGLLAAAALVVAFVVVGFVAPGFLLPEPSVSQAPARPESGLDFVPSAEQEATMARLHASLSANGGHFSSEDARQKENAKLFTYMAATSDERSVVEASLEAMGVAYSPRATRKEAPDADLDRVLIKHLASSDRAIFAKALAAAQVPLLGKAPGERLVLAITERAKASKDGPTRYVLIELLSLLRPERRTAPVIEVFESALAASEPYVVADALVALEQSIPALQRTPSLRSKELVPRVVELTKHADPGVRGGALHLLGELDGDEPHRRALELALNALADPHPYVRGVACDVLGRLGYVPAVHRLMDLVDDRALARHEVRGFAKLDGSAGSLSFGVPGRQHVSEAAMYAISSLSPGQLSLRIGGAQRTDESLRESTELTKAWYEKTKSRIPQISAEASR